MYFYFKKVSPPLIAGSIYILCTTIGMLINPLAFTKLFSLSSPVGNIPEGYYWDLQHYAGMALGDKCSAFYPLWPSVIRFLFHPQTIPEAAKYFMLLGNIIFFCSLGLLSWLLKKAFERRYIALLCLIAYAINPMSIFHSIGYTESLFSLLVMAFMWSFLQIKDRRLQLLVLFCIVFTMSLTRPVMIQIIFSSLASLATMMVFRKLQNKTKHNQEIKITLTLILGSILGYSIYGFSCLKLRGDFLAPFNDQKHWGKNLGLHLSSLFIPRSTVLDLTGFYLSLLILICSLIFIYYKLKNRKLVLFIPQAPWWNFFLLYPPLGIFLYTFYYLKGRLKELKLSEYSKTLSENYLFWFSIYFIFAHAAILFLTDNYLTSLGRLTFALPFFFLAVGYLSRCLPEKKLHTHLLWLILFSGVGLIRQWVLYGHDKWLG